MAAKSAAQQLLTVPQLLFRKLTVYPNDSKKTRPGQTTCVCSPPAFSFRGEDQMLSIKSSSAHSSAFITHDLSETCHTSMQETEEKYTSYNL